MKPFPRNVPKARVRLNRPFRWIAVLLLLAISPLQADLRSQIERAENIRDAGNYKESLEIAREALAEAREEEAPERVGEALLQTILAHYFLENHDEARSLLEIGLTHCRLHDLPSLEADLLNAEGVLEWKAGNLWLGRRLLENAFSMKERLGEEESMVSIANNLGIISYSLKEYPDAVRHYRKGLAMLEEGQNPRLRASLLSNLGESLLRLENYDGAEEHLQRSLAIEKDLKEPHYLAYTYFNLGELHAAKGNAREAKELYRKALRLQEEDGNVWGASLTRLHLARLCHSLGRTEEAFAALEPGYEAAKALNALSLLRDYAALCEEIHEATGEDGLQTYYADLRDWFSERLRTSGDADLPAQPRPLDPPEGSGGEVPAPQLSPWRYSVVALLLLLILALLVEIRRLRRKKQPAAGG